MDKAHKLLYECRMARDLMLRGKISITDARAICQKYVDYFNKNSVKIAKKYGKKPYKITTTGLLR